MPDCVVWRIWWRGDWADGGEGVVVSMSSSSVAAALDAKASFVEGRDRWDWTRWREVGKWPVWKVDL